MYKKLTLLILMAILPSFALAETALISVNGMVCAFCTQAIKKKVEGHEEVASTDVDLDKKLVTINFKEGKTMNDDQLKEVITAAGYAVTKIERS